MIISDGKAHVPISMRTYLCWWFVLVCPVLLGIFWQDLTALNGVKKKHRSGSAVHSTFYGWVCFLTFLNLFLMSAYVSSLTCLPVLGLYTRKSLFLVFTSFTKMDVFLLFRIWKKIPFNISTCARNLCLSLPCNTGAVRISDIRIKNSNLFLRRRASSAYLNIEAIIWTILICPNVRCLLPGHASLHTHLVRKRKIKTRLMLLHDI